MERVHFSAIEKKWQKIFNKTKLVTEIKKNFISWNVSVPIWKIHMGHVRITQVM